MTTEQVGWRLPLGRGMAAAAIVLALYGTTALLVMDRSDHFAGGVAMFAVFAIGFGALAWLAIPLQPNNRALWVPAWASFFAGISTAAWATAILIGDLAGLDVSASSWAHLTPSEVPITAAISYQIVPIGPIAGFFLMVTLWPLLFPNGDLPSRRWRWVAWSSVIMMVLLTGALVWFYRPDSTLPYDAPFDVGPGFEFVVELLYFVLLGWSVACGVSLIARQRRNTGDVRQQYRWVVLGTGALFFSVFIVDDQRAWQLTAAMIAMAISVAAYGVAVTKYRLYDIDVVISRTFVYGTLAAFIGAVYVLVVVVVGRLVDSSEGNLGLAITATALVAIAFEPVRQRAQRWANRLVYGKRATPYEVLSDLTRRLAGTEPAQGRLDRMAQLMAEGTGADQSTVWLADRSERLIATAGWPQIPSPGEAESMDQLSGVYSPVLHDDRIVGVVQVVKSRGNPVTPTELRLIEDLAGSAGLVLGNERLNADLAARAAELRASRRRLVEVQDAERRVLERDLHDGAQQQVVALKIRIGLAEHVAKRDGADGLAGILSGLAAEAQAAVDEIRRLARGIYPPLLESEDLSAAIKSQAAALSVPVEVSSEGINHYAKDIESAFYFAAVEGMANAVKHGTPSLVRVDLSGSPEELALQLSDDGDGFDPADSHNGTGLINIRDRVEALGGDVTVTSVPGKGTTLRVRVPLDGALPDSKELVGLEV